MCLAISPPSIPSSDTRWLFPGPPTEGLQDIMAILSKYIVNSAVFSPILADARAASTPACPAPTTIIS